MLHSVVVCDAETEVPSNIGHDNIHSLFTVIIMLLYLYYQEGAGALIRAADNGDIEAVKRQLRGHTDINSRDEVYN